MNQPQVECQAFGLSNMASNTVLYDHFPMNIEMIWGFCTSFGQSSKETWRKVGKPSKYTKQNNQYHIGGTKFKVTQWASFHRTLEYVHSPIPMVQWVLLCDHITPPSIRN
jgi:hypothetical protein